MTLRTTSGRVEMSGVGTVLAGDLATFETQQAREVLRLALVFAFDGRERVLAVRFNSADEASEGREAISRALAAAPSPARSDAALDAATGEELAAILLSPDFPAVLARVRALLSAAQVLP